MLRSLHIENIAVIRRADLDFDKGFSVLSGETGAGKSIIVDSINLLLGNRVAREIIRSGESRAVVSAVFEDLSPTVVDTLAGMGFAAEDGTLMLQRTLTADGRSQTRLNGQAVTLTVQKEIARLLIGIHGQSDSLMLTQKGTHRALLDAFARPDAALADYREAYREWKEICRKLSAVSRDESEKIRLSEMLKFQISDIDAVRPKVGEEEALTKERDRLLHMEKINKQARFAYRALGGGESGSARDLIRRARNALQSISAIVEDTEPLISRLEAAESEITDIAETALGYADEGDGDPTARIDRIEARLEALSKLKRKYGTGAGEILAFRERAQKQLDELAFSDEEREKLGKEAVRAEKACRERAAVLTGQRKRAAGEITARVTESLAFLDMPKVRFDVRIDPSEPNETGADEIEFLIATNVGEPLLPMARIASGGELSRIMLALRSVLNDKDGAATVIFDEVDTGVSGKTSRKVGIKLKETAKNAQVLCVTHSAQIASLADTHYLISKSEKDGRAETTVRILDEEERVGEIARILGGIEITEVQRQAAREMIAEYR